jgi:hypothetical protein
MIDKLNLGIVYENGKVVNHRSFVKVILNPFFRTFGFCIATNFDIDKQKLYHPVFIKCNRKTKLEFGYPLCNRKIVKRRRLI